MLFIAFAEQSKAKNVVEHPMPKWIPDTAGYFHIRPQYSAREINRICERAIIDILKLRHGGNFKRPIGNDDLIALLKSLGAEIELNFEFPSESAWVQGETEFQPNKAPAIKIARDLPENRWRSTVGHEGGHLLLLRDAYGDRANVINWGSAFRLSCAHQRTNQHNWMEWQADECSGAMLIPSRILRMVMGPADQMQIHSATSSEGVSLISAVSTFFHTSREFTTVRLRRLGYLRRPHPRHQFQLPFDVPLPLEA
jgi:hypothetical protein